MLTSLPLDLLRHVTGYLEGLHIGLLWFCGDSRLQHRLGSDRGVVHFHLVYDPLYPFVWPSLIRNFELESFVVTLRFKETNAPIWKPSFSDLKGSKLTTLSLCCPGDPGPFYGYLSSNPDAYPRLERFSSVYHIGASNLRLFVEHLPSLRQVLTTTHFNALVPSDLPRNLTHIYLKFVSVDTSLGIRFPDSLETLRLVVVKLSQVTPLFAGLPAGLQSLDLWMEVFTDTTYKPTPECYGHLPRGLKHLRTTSTGLTAACLAALPPHLESLDLFGHCLDNSFWAYDGHAAVKALPRTLTRFDIPVFPWTSQAIQYLPHTLTKIKPYVYAPIDAVAAHLPHLRKVCINYNVKPIPDCVTEVIALELDDLELHALPSGLKILKLGLSDVPDLFERLKELPKNLVRLDISQEEEYGGPIPRLENQTHHLKRLLPLQLKVLQLDLSSFAFSPEDCNVLPKGLTELSLKGIEFQSSVTDAFSQLPPRLEKLHITTARLEVGCLKALPCSKLRNLSLEYIEDHSGLVTRDLCMSLPRRLAYLELSPGGLDVHNVNDEVFMNLPPGLCSLIIHYLEAESFDGSCKSHLPKSLTYVELAGYFPSWLQDEAE